jgi:hypothetical protein
MGVNASQKSKKKISGKILKCPKCGFNINLTDEKNLTYIDIKEHTGFDSNKKKLDRRTQIRVKKEAILRLNNKIALLIDISENGMNLASYDIPKEPNVAIKIKIMGKTFNLKGLIRWLTKKDHFTGLSSIGIYLEDPPDKYKLLIRELTR